MAKPTYKSYEVFNLFDSETHEWWKGLTREQLAGFVAGTFTKPHWYQFISTDSKKTKKTKVIRKKQLNSKYLQKEQNFLYYNH